MEIGQNVKIIDTEKVKKDKHLEENALKIIEKNNFEGKITKILDNEIYFVGFKNNLGWVTQGFKSKEIEVI